MEKGLGINYQLSVPPSGYASPIYVDGGGRPLPVANAGEYPERLSLRTVTDAGLDEGDDTEARPVDESAELERMRRFLDDANPEDFDTS
jgi:hypothetical protein